MFGKSQGYRDIVFPLLTKVAPDLTGVTAKAKVGKAMKAMFEDVVAEHKRRFDPRRDEAGNFIEAFLKEIASNPGGGLDEKELVGSCMDFFEAGGETVGATLSWALLYLSLRQDVQEKCYREIRSIDENAVTLDDKDKLPYCEATVMEIQRMAASAPSSLEHKAMEDLTLEGFSIPKGTLVVYNIYKFLSDPEYWGDPDVFRPERFLDGGRRRERFVPFGFGRRVCPGESLAKAELFLFVTHIIKRVKLSPPKSPLLKRPDPKNYVAGMTRAALPFHLHIEVR